MQRLPFINHGEMPSARWFREAEKIMRSATPLPGPGSLLTVTPHGHTRRVPIQFGGIGGSAPTSLPIPFTCTLSSITVDDVAEPAVTIVPGAVNQIFPSNMFDGTSGLPQFALSGEDITYVKVNGTTDGGNFVTSCTIVADENNVNPSYNFAAGSPPGSFSVLIAVITGDTVGLTALYQIATGNILAIPQVAFLQSVSPDEPGDEPFERWWQWTIIQTPDDQ